MLVYISARASLGPLNASKTFGGRAPPGPAGGAHSAPPDPLAGFKGAASRQGRGKGRGEGRGGGVTPMALET